MTPEQLKASILQLAIQGKLVEQRAEEGTGEELYQQIQANLDAISEVQTKKKNKILPNKILPIEEKDIPFDIPETWRWVRLGTIGYTNIGLTYRPKDQTMDGVIVLRSSNIQNGKMVYEDIVKVNMEIPDNKMCKVGDILICARNGSKRLVGKSAIVDKAGMSFGAFMAIFRSVCNQYIIHVINSAYFRNSLLGDTGTTTINQITQDMLKNSLVPLPPLAEQKRIVAKIEELLPYVDRYAAAYEKLEQFNAKFPEDMKKSILEYAIQGKLVEQRAEEGTGEELFQEIERKREVLIKEKIIKKDKRTNSIINFQEVPFDIPENWMWVTLGSILNKLTDGTHKTPKYTSTGVKFVSVKDMSNGFLSLENTKYISEEEHKELYARCNPEKGDLILSKVGTTGVPAIVDTTEPFSLFVSVALLKFDCKCIDIEFLYYMLMSPLVQAQATENTRGVGNKNWVLDAIASTMVVLPPLVEQKRIVAKLEEILPLCERLK